MDFRALEHLMTCPFNPAHQVAQHRMAKHIVKCKKNYPNADMKTCLFNALHIVPRQEMKSHIVDCDSRYHTERRVFERQQTIISSQEVPRAEPTFGEDWDTELVQASYNPTENILYREIVRPPPVGLGKAARKLWRAKESERVQRLQSGLPIEDLIFPATAEGASKDTEQPQEPCGAAASSAQPPAAAVEDEPNLSCKDIMKGVQPLRRPRIAANFTGEGSSSVIGGGRGSLSPAPHPAPTIPTTTKMPPNATTVEVNETSKDIIKEKRKLEKKLHAIAKLEHRKAEGQKLNKEEEAKVEQRQALVEQLALLLHHHHL